MKLLWFRRWVRSNTMRLVLHLKNFLEKKKRRVSLWQSREISIAEGLRRRTRNFTTVLPFSAVLRVASSLVDRSRELL